MRQRSQRAIVQYHWLRGHCLIKNLRLGCLITRLDHNRLRFSVRIRRCSLTSHLNILLDAKLSFDELWVIFVTTAGHDCSASNMLRCLLACRAATKHQHLLLVLVHVLL